MLNGSAPKPLIAGMNNDHKFDYSPRPIFFFERSDGSIINVEEEAAWGLYSRRQQFLYKQGVPLTFKLIGTGDGKIYYQALQEAKELGKTDIVKAQERLRQGVSEELEACRGKIIAPRNMDKMGDQV